MENNMNQTDDELRNARIKKSKSMELASLIIWIVGILIFNSNISNPIMEVVLMITSLSAMVFYILLRVRRYQYESKK